MNVQEGEGGGMGWRERTEIRIDFKMNRSG